MRLSRTLHGNAPLQLKMPVIDPGGSANIEEGAALLAGATSNRSGLILATGAFPDFAGMAAEQVATGNFGTVAAGTLSLPNVLLEPTALWMVEWSQTAADIDSNDVSSCTSTAVTMSTAGAANFHGGWIYVVSGTGLGQLRYMKDGSSTTVYTVGTSMSWTTTLDNTSDLLFISPINNQLQDMEATARKFKGLNGIGGAAVGRVAIVQNWIEHDALPLQVLKPGSAGATHGKLDGLNNYTKLKFYAEVFFTDTILQKID